MDEGNNGVPRWVEEKFLHIDHEITRIEAKFDDRLDDLNDKVDKLADKIDTTRDNVSNLIGKFAVISAGIGAATAALFTLIVRLITK